MKDNLSGEEFLCVLISVFLEIISSKDFIYDGFFLTMSFQSS